MLFIKISGIQMLLLPCPCNVLLQYLDDAVCCAPNGYSLRVVGVPQSRGTVQMVSTLSCLTRGPGPHFFGKPVMQPRIMAGGAPAPCGRHESNPGPKPTLKPFYTHSLNPPHSINALIHQSNPLNPRHPHSPQPTHPHLSPLQNIRGLPLVESHCDVCCHLQQS